MSDEPERTLDRKDTDLATAMRNEEDERVHQFSEDDIIAGTRTQGAPSHEAATGDIGAKQQSLIQKCKI